jgi:hypothetical protein
MAFRYVVANVSSSQYSLRDGDYIEPPNSLNNPKFIPYEYQFHFTGFVERGNVDQFREALTKYPQLLHAVWKGITSPCYYDQRKKQFEVSKTIFTLYCHRSHRAPRLLSCM